jgi:phosphotransferase system enzyme I (PtsP)
MAATHGPIRLLFPMISTVEEIQRCKEIVRDAREKLTGEGQPCAGSLELGAMIEVPAAIQLAPHLAREVDFFSLGTNDLVQYMLAVDRTNPRVQNYYEPLHPAVLLALDSLANTAREERIDLCICGEMPSDPAAMVALIGLRIYQFSLAAPCIPRLKRFISRVDTQAAEQLARQVIQQADAQTIRRTLEQAVDQFPEPLY